MDLPTPRPDVERASEAELENLGPFLVSKLAQDVDRVRISGYNYVSFKINVPR